MLERERENTQNNGAHLNLISQNCVQAGSFATEIAKKPNFLPSTVTVYSLSCLLLRIWKLQIYPSFLLFFFSLWVGNDYEFFLIISKRKTRHRISSTGFRVSSFGWICLFVTIVIILIYRLMDLRGIVLVGIVIAEILLFVANGNLVLRVERRKRGYALSEMKERDERRRGRLLSDVDLNLGGNSHPTDTGLYYTKLGLGSPPKDYYVQVDTGSDILWVNCVGCSRCPRKSDLGIDLTLYDPKDSKTSELISCDQEFCSSTYDGPIAGCTSDTPCPYSITYGDGSATTGYYVQDYLTYNRVDGNLRTAPQNSSIIFGCGNQQSGTLGSSSEEALDGIIGFGQANSSVLSQLAASGKVKKIFSHCLDNIGGGGIFAIGEVVEPTVKTTPLLPKMAHYNVVLKGIEVDKDVLQLPTDIFDSGVGKGTVIDSGTTLAYLPSIAYDQLLSKVLARQAGLKLYLVEQQFTCFQYTGNVDEGFPVVKFHFEDSLSLTVYPRDYLFQFKGNIWCIGWQRNAAQSKNGKDMTLLGDLVLSNKLVVYDLENMVIGWTDYNCSSTIKVKDEKTGTVYTVGAHNLSCASTFLIGRILTFFLLLIPMLNSLTN